VSFDHIQVLFFELLLIPLLLWSFAHYRNKRRGISAFLKALGEDRRALPAANARRYRRSQFFFLIFAASMIMALAGPRWGIRLVNETRRGVDVILALDVSRSMNAQDTEPSRLLRGVEIARELVEASGGLRFGLALGRGRGVLALPLSGDTEAVLNYLAVISSASATGAGTNLEELLDAAAGAFQDSLPSKRRVVLFSDGEAHTGALEGALEKLRARDIAVIAVGLGLEEGAPVPVEQGVLSGGDGRPVLSALHAAALRGGAEKSGGIYIDGNRQDAAGILKTHIEGLAAEGLSGGVRRESRPRWQFFMFLGLAALFLSRVSAGSFPRGRGGRP
jgi:Ca-activated chloride channel family protein